MDHAQALTTQQRMRIAAGSGLAVREVERLLKEAREGDGSTLRPGYALMRKLHGLVAELAKSRKLDPDVEAWLNSMAALGPEIVPSEPA